MSILTELQDTYIDVEQQIAALWPKRFASACGTCTQICCRPHMADEVLESPWLKSVSHRVHGNWWELPNDNPLCAALSKKGCILTAGKPPFCYSFYCDSLLENETPYALVADLFLSGILTHACKLEKNQNLIELTLEEVAGHADQIHLRLQTAQQHVALYKKFQQATDIEKAPLAFAMLVEMPNLLTKAVRTRLQALITS